MQPPAALPSKVTSPQMPHIFLLVRNACPTRERLSGAATINAYEVGLVPLTLWQAIRRDIGRDTGRDMGLKSAVKTGC
jgi:hypothetical protein